MCGPALRTSAEQSSQGRASRPRAHANEHVLNPIHTFCPAGRRQMLFPLASSNKHRPGNATPQSGSGQSGDGMHRLMNGIHDLHTHLWVVLVVVDCSNNAVFLHH